MWFRSRGEREDDERRKERKRKKSPPAMRMRADDYEKRTREEKTRLKSTVVSKAALEVEYEEEQVRAGLVEDLVQLEIYFIRPTPTPYLTLSNLLFLGRGDRKLGACAREV